MSRLPKIDVTGLRMFHDPPSNIGAADCLCSKCEQVIGVPLNDLRWDSHDEDACEGCPICETPITVWRATNGKPDGEYRFCGVCFSELVNKTLRPETVQ